jgi:2-polyprenyl-6-methoxyphenol hydroxylase-like FAD-dependent oxidoreductase
MDGHDHPVVIAGAGPVGLSLALGLSRCGVRSLVLEKKPALSPHSRALLITTRTLDVFRAWGVLDRFKAEGFFLTEVPVWVVGDSAPQVTLDLRRQAGESTIRGVLIMPQDHTERLLLEAVQTSGLAEVRFSHAVTGFTQGATGVAVRYRGADGSEAEVGAAFLVGCDGARSQVREVLGWPLEGKTYPARIVLADVRMRGERDQLPWPRLDPRPPGFCAAVRIEPQLWRLIIPVPPAVPDALAQSEEWIEERVTRVFGPGPFEPVWISLFRIHCRNSPAFVHGRVVLAGDAAHLNSPAGGQGMNAGIHDAHNLAWKLRAALEGGSIQALLRSYEEERRGAVIGTVDRITDLLTRLVLTSTPAVRFAFGRVARLALRVPAVQRNAVLQGGMLGTRYERSSLLPDGDLSGTRTPDVELERADGTRVGLLELVGYEALLLSFNERPAPATPGIRGVRIVPRDAPLADGALRDATGELWHKWRPRRGDVVLIRPDGHVAWRAHTPEPENLTQMVERALETGFDKRRTTPLPARRRKAAGLLALAAIGVGAWVLARRSG